MAYGGRCVCVCVCVCGSLLSRRLWELSFLVLWVKKDLVDFQVSAHRYIHKGFFTRDFFFPRADMPSRGVFVVFIFAQEKWSSLGEFRAHGTTWARAICKPNI